MSEFMEIKPLSPSGITRGIAQIGLYTAIFSPRGFSRGSWTPPPLIVDGTRTWFVNVQGVIFYTDDEGNLKDLLVVSSFAAARAALRHTRLVATRIGVDAAVTAVRNRLISGLAQAAAYRVAQYQFVSAAAAQRRF